MQKIESFLYWSASGLMLTLAVIPVLTYFTTYVEQREVLVAIQFQLLTFTTATLCCPAVPIPTWFPFPFQYRFIVLLTSLLIMELMPY